MRGTYLITGGTGSLGTELVKKLLKIKYKKIIVFSRDEYKQYLMKKELDSKDIRFFIGDIRDKERLHRALNGVDYVIHCAALKHVSTGEYNPFEVVQTNIIGAQNLIEASIDNNVKKVLAISTDKAVNPSNLYGAAKLCSDKMFIGGNVYDPKIQMAVVRFGNFTGSRGSVVEYFRQLKREGVKEFPVTDLGMTRFFISLEDAAQKTLNILDIMKGGEIFCPKMESKSIRRVAKDIETNATLKIIGAREGEKLTEELILESDKAYEYEGFYIIFNTDKVYGEKLPYGFSYRSNGL